MAKGKKKKNSTAMIVLMTLLSLTVVTFLVVVCAFFAGISDKRKTESYVGSGAMNEIATEKVTVKINMENCTMVVGTKVQVTATIYPDGSSSGIMWSSSDENVFTVDSKGNLEVVGPGIVALTASFGDAYDSIAIECVADESEATLNLPDYSMFTVNGGNTTGNSNQQGTQNSTHSSKAETTSSGVSQQTNPTTAKNNSQNVTTKDTAAVTTATTTKPVTQVPTTTQQVTQKHQNITPETTSYVIETTPEYEGEKVLSTQIAGNLPDYGFKKYLDNTYVYEENDAYLGEIIISSNMTHIYVKDRSTGFDSALTSVLAELLPDSHENVWSIYSGATTDQTMTVDGRVVRVVVAGNGGHSQIVIYN